MTPKASKSETTRQAILDRALKLFQKKNYESVTMRELAKACNLSLGAFYYHFKNKEEIVLEMYRTSLAGHITRTEEFLGSGRPKSLHETMKWICQDRFQEFSPYPSVLRVLAQRLDPQDPISPWHESAMEIRRKSIDLFEKVTVACFSAADTKTRRTLAQALWLHHILILGYWSFDRSANRRNTSSILGQSAYLWKSLPALLKIPGFKAALPQLLAPLAVLDQEHP